VSRSLSLRAARHFRAGTPRAAEPGARLRCLVLAPGPDWVAVDVATGALVRRFAPQARADAESGLAATFSAVELVLAQPDEPDDPARPEAVRLAGPPTALPPPRPRAVRRLVDHLVASSPTQPLLGTLGPSIAYGDLDGSRPSIAVVEPDRLPRFGNGPTGPWCQFSLGGRRHALPVAGRLDAGFAGAAESSEPMPRSGAAGGSLPSPSRRRRRVKAAAVGAELPRWLVVAFGQPVGGQVPKVVLGALPDPRRAR